jgi:hypothetical protein
MAPLRQPTLTGVHPVARGPVALEAADVDGDGDVDLGVLAYEQRSFQVLINHAH